jgi:acyl carrier protein
MNDDINKRIINLISIILNIKPNEIKESLAYNSIERWDSIAQMNIILSLEEEFNIQLLDEDIEDMLTVELIIKIISSKI